MAVPAMEGSLVWKFHLGMVMYLPSLQLYITGTLGKGLKMKKKSGPGAHFGGGSAIYFGGPQFYCDFWKKSRLGGILSVHLWIFSCKDKTMEGYNVLEMYLRTI